MAEDVRGETTATTDSEEVADLKARVARLTELLLRGKELPLYMPWVPQQVLHEMGLNPFAVTLVAESWRGKYFPGEGGRTVRFTADGVQFILAAEDLDLRPGVEARVLGLVALGHVDDAYDLAASLEMDARVDLLELLSFTTSMVNDAGDRLERRDESLRRLRLRLAGMGERFAHLAPDPELREGAAQ